MLNHPPGADDSSDLFLADDPPSGPAAFSDRPPWRILIVDDDVDVHVVTKFALNHSNFQGRRLSFLHAYSGEEAIAVLRDTPDIALVLLDVIMETDDAGLRVVRRIRDELHNNLVRIVLRTGQPGQSQEQSLIIDYDVNDFWHKTDLTTRKLLTTVIASLRAYSTLTAAVARSAELDIELAKTRAAQALVGHHALTLTLDRDGRILDASDMLCRVTNLGRDELIGRDLHALHPGPFPEPLASQIMAELGAHDCWSGDIHTSLADGAALSLRCAVQVFREPGGKRVQYMAAGTLINTAS